MHVVNCSGGKCQDHLQKLRDEILDYETKINATKEKYHEVLIVNLKKDAVMYKLEKDLENSKFMKYGDILGHQTVDSLKLLSNAPPKDSTFILIAMKGLYRNDLSLLKTMTYSGRTKEKMPQEKIDILKNLFIERLEAESDCVERNANFGKHIKSAIESINKMSNRQ